VCGNPTKPGQPDDPLIAVARARGIEIFQPKSWKTPESLEKMKSFHADLCLMAYVTKFFPLEVAAVPTYGSACYHPSLLPMHRGPSAISWAIATGKKTTGITIFEPTDGLDGKQSIKCYLCLFTEFCFIITHAHVMQKRAQSFSKNSATSEKTKQWETCTPRSCSLWVWMQ